MKAMTFILITINITFAIMKTILFLINKVKVYCPKLHNLDRKNSIWKCDQSFKKMDVHFLFALNNSFKESNLVLHLPAQPSINSHHRCQHFHVSSSHISPPCRSPNQKTHASVSVIISASFISAQSCFQSYPRMGSGSLLHISWNIGQVKVERQYKMCLKDCALCLNPNEKQVRIKFDGSIRKLFGFTANNCFAANNELFAQL